MGHSQTDKQKTHETIVAVASRRLRERGLDGIGVAELMKEAGLTVGGFYKHFASRDDLVAEAMQSAFGDWERKVRSSGVNPADVSMRDYVNNYLSAEHRDDTGGGCPFAALSGDLARSGTECRELATRQISANLEDMTARIARDDQKAGRQNAIVAVCALMGAIGIARIIDDEPLSSEILDAVKTFATQLGEN
jgi:TetR/AcrR family transcriptional repressor of nem operon